MDGGCNIRIHMPHDLIFTYCCQVRMPALYHFLASQRATPYEYLEWMLLASSVHTRVFLAPARTCNSPSPISHARCPVVTHWRIAHVRVSLFHDQTP